MNESDPSSAPAPRDVPEKTPGTSESPRTPPGILVVDDEEPIGLMLSMMLEQYGCLVWFTTSSDQALEIYRLLGKSINLVLLDVRMPDKDGPRTLRALQEIDREVRCCFMSGDIGHYTEAELLDCGAIGLLRKPFKIEELERFLEQKVFPSVTPPFPPGDGPAPGAGDPQSAALERRRLPRYTENPVEVLLTKSADEEETARALVLDRSFNGVCLSLNEALAVGTILNIHPSNDPAAPSCFQLEVKYCIPQGNLWRVGCQFKRPGSTSAG